MMNKITPYLYLLLFIGTLSSCITRQEIKYMQPNESLVINEEGLIPYNIQEYRITKNDILDLNIVTTPKGDAAQFYSKLNTSESGNVTPGGSGGSMSASGDSRFYFNGIKVDSQGDIYVFGIGFIKAEGRTVEDIQKEIQQHVNQNFVEGKSEVRLNLNGIKYYILGDIETTDLTGEKVSHTQTLNLMEAIAKNGGLNRTIDRKNVILQRRYPEGIKTIQLDLTREDVQNSPYYWIQNGDIIYLNTRPKNFFGFGKDPLQTLTTGVSLMTTALTIYYLITR